MSQKCAVVELCNAPRYLLPEPHIVIQVVFDELLDILVRPFMNLGCNAVQFRLQLRGEVNFHDLRVASDARDGGRLIYWLRMKIPTFEELPIRKDLPADCSWGVFGDDDALGCLNFLTAEGVVEAAGLVKSGKVFRLDANIGFAKPPLFGRAPAEHRGVALAPMANDDFVHFNTQEGSQWDGLGHVGPHPA